MFWISGLAGTIITLLFLWWLLLKTAVTIEPGTLALLLKLTGV